MLLPENQRDQLWKLLQGYLYRHPEPPIYLYFRDIDGQQSGLPLEFPNGDFRQPRLLVTEEAAVKAQQLPEPHKTVFLKEYLKNRHFSLNIACQKYFGPLLRPSRATHVYNPYQELRFDREVVEKFFPTSNERVYYEEYLKIDTLAALAERLGAAQPAVVQEPDISYTATSRFPTNQILYGPSGTGKTYQTVAYAVAIIEGKSLVEVSQENRAALMRRYEKYKENEQIEFITFHQSYAYEDFVQGLRPDVHSGAEGLRFRLSDGVFKRLADRAKANYQAYQQTITRPKLAFESLLDGLLTERMNRETEEVEIPLVSSGGQFKSLVIYEAGDTYLKYKRRTLRNTIRDEERILYLHKLKDKYEGREIREAINKPYYEAVDEALRQYERSLRVTQEGGQLRHYVLIIDEINRANISRVFGELITLLEEDKRLGRENELVTTLPSGETFAVPPNLFLVGTMNTADKSVALLDVALRRRFTFVPVYPDYSLVPEFEPVLRPLNEKIRDRKGTDYLIGHSYFIGKTPADLPDIFNQKIIPLLYEYFQNRPEPVQEILLAAGLNVTEENFQWRVG